MFALQRLNTGQVMAVVVSVQGLVLFFNPFFSFISISEDTNGEKAFLRCVNLYEDMKKSEPLGGTPRAGGQVTPAYLWKRCTS